MRVVGHVAYVITRALIWLTATLLWRIRIDGRENLPSEGAFLLSPVHRANIDGPLTAIFTKRHMRYLAKEEIFSIKWLGALFTSMGAIRVNRGVPDRHSLKLCQEVLEAGFPLVLFPEGTRREGDQVTEVLEGAAYLALRSGVPIVPVGIANSEKANPRGKRFFRPAKIRVSIGAPIEFARPVGSDRVPRSTIRDATDKVTRCLQESYDNARAMVQ